MFMKCVGESPLHDAALPVRMMQKGSMDADEMVTSGSRSSPASEVDSNNSPLIRVVVQEGAAVSANMFKPQELDYRFVPIRFKRDLIQVVKQFPALYDTRHPDYNDAKNRPSLWQTVRDRMIAKGYSKAEGRREMENGINFAAALCPARWRSLKASYVKERKAALKCSMENNSYKSKWLLFSDMDFIAAYVDDPDSRDCTGYETSNSGEVQRAKQKHVIVEDVLTDSDDDSASDSQTPKAKRRRSANELRTEETLAHVRATSSAVTSLCEALLKDKTGGCEFCAQLSNEDRQFMRTLGGLTSQLDREYAERLRKHLLQVACADFARMYADSCVASYSDSVSDSVDRGNGAA
ncbi:unnamed protein product [Toxocara canis]|uniref:MADF domain-containing protein n=1 Tax=Toxocara canis TaxID=6265 RepID=A0A183VCR0_TOXCA|nr:unnamed protein product [Toxocara canis]